MMDPQLIFATRDDLWRVHAEINSIYNVQAEHADRLMRLERRQEEDARLKSVWGASSPFPGILSGTPQQESVSNPAAEAFSRFNERNPSNLLGGLHLDNDDESRRVMSRANSVRFDESAMQNQWAQGGRSSAAEPLSSRLRSGLGTLPMTERSASHKSDGRQSSAGFSVHSAQSTHSGRESNLGLDAGSALGATVGTPLGTSGPPPGLFALGPVPSIIRCWLSTEFSHDSLLYAAVCTGSYSSLVDRRLVKQLQLESHIQQHSHGEEKIRMPVYLPEAIVQQPSTGVTSPEPQVPTFITEFTIVENLGRSVESGAIQVILGSDFLRFHNADILFSQNAISLFDHDRNKLSVPMVRPEDESTFKRLATVSSPITSGIEMSDRSSKDEYFSHGRRSRLQSPVSRVASPNDPVKGDWRRPASSSATRPPAEITRAEVDKKSQTEDIGVIGDSKRAKVSTDQSRDAENAPLDEPSGELSGLQVSPANDTWGSWRRDQAQDTGPSTGSYQAVPSGRGMKVLKPLKSTAGAPSRSYSGSLSAIAGPEGSEARRRVLQASDVNAVEDRLSRGNWRSSSVDMRNASQTPSTSSAGTAKPRSANPIGGATAFGWLNSGQRKQAATGE
ncbi:hypothetical protein L228DRAFT_155350 [Xylona heveae TC161]|uniref:Ubiquitin carboxyl-terminal hydrolase 19 n=1 Tax=Xylona heveae (strain CBS 132557 / TC161) TaxID=1328760 RepID=A0A165FYL0_XYLHT|nr:hypothetical protein L228DRAFT_155350 [Xylona heveae TC161]KZF21537.1 hypothetical protein L228DRAFT_155350 [Xylona heveae TC161]